jgi:exportin-1
VLQLGADEFKLFVDSAMWAVKHMQRPCMETGLHLVDELLHNMGASPVAQLFYERYLLPILQDMLVVLTDTFHMPGTPRPLRPRSSPG